MATVFKSRISIFLSEFEVSNRWRTKMYQRKASLTCWSLERNASRLRSVYVKVFSFCSRILRSGSRSFEMERFLQFCLLGSTLPDDERWLRNPKRLKLYDSTRSIRQDIWDCSAEILNIWTSDQIESFNFQLVLLRNVAGGRRNSNFSESQDLVSCSLSGKRSFKRSLFWACRCCWSQQDSSFSFIKRASSRHVNKILVIELLSFRKSGLGCKSFYQTKIDDGFTFNPPNFTKGTNSTSGRELVHMGVKYSKKL